MKKLLVCCGPGYCLFLCKILTLHGLRLSHQGSPSVSIWIYLYQANHKKSRKPFSTPPPPSCAIKCLPKHRAGPRRTCRRPLKSAVT
ncbi:hypothetical protein BS47DRAFT_978891 [Hydnum rufescens UP504]|uniref:Uncharacterized protein n=1 Tax=Hydnum rufescens UP504 TaxID=1448309 RepID=A0A9P6AWD0_9AGAM|nr:hypothetical protein BS47DRAFT_978891 [Hydnum rufescens UP504]